MVAGNGSLRENAAKNTHNVMERLLLEGYEGSLGDAKVLDIPCGDGAFTKRLLDRGVNVVSGDVVNDIQKVLPQCRFVQSDMDRRFPFEDGHFTDVVCIDGIEHIERQFDFIRECNRVLQVSGRIILSTPNVSSARSRWRYFLTGHHNKCKSPLNEKHITPLHHKNMISFPELRYLLHTNGFELEAVRTNRAKGASLLYAFAYPFLYCVTSLVYRKEESDPGQRQRNREIRRAMFSGSVYFGETLIVSAKKTKQA